jgi:mannose-6-phosphate isomerase-like protein (cupin superfamily)
MPFSRWLLPVFVLIPMPACADSLDRSHPADAIDTHGAEHYVWGGANEGWYLAKNANLTVIQERVVPGGEEISHYHRKARQFFYVLSGELHLRADGYDNVVKAGQGIEIAPGKIHQATNPGSQPLDILVISSPDSHSDRVEARAVE